MPRWAAGSSATRTCWSPGGTARRRAAPGGAGDTVRRALERGLPVVWLKPAEPHPRLVDPAHLHQHAEAAETVLRLADIAEPL